MTGVQTCALPIFLGLQLTHVIHADQVGFSSIIGGKKALIGMVNRDNYIPMGCQLQIQRFVAGFDAQSSVGKNNQRIGIALISVRIVRIPESQIQWSGVTGIVIYIRSLFVEQGRLINRNTMGPVWVNGLLWGKKNRRQTYQYQQ